MEYLLTGLLSLGSRGNYIKPYQHNHPGLKILKEALFYFTYLLAVLGFEFRAWYLTSKCTTT
jgi:hypothetical protein